MAYGVLMHRLMLCLRRDMNIAFETPFKQAAAATDSHMRPHSPRFSPRQVATPSISDAWAKLKQRQPPAMRQAAQRPLNWLTPSRGQQPPASSPRIKRSRSLPRCLDALQSAVASQHPAAEHHRSAHRPSRTGHASHAWEKLASACCVAPATARRLQLVNYQATDMVSYSNLQAKRQRLAAQQSGELPDDVGMDCSDSADDDAGMEEDGFDILPMRTRSPSPECAMQLRSPDRDCCVFADPDADALPDGHAAAQQMHSPIAGSDLSPRGQSLGSCPAGCQPPHAALLRRAEGRSDWSSILQHMHREVQQSLVLPCAALELPGAADAAAGSGASPAHPGGGTFDDCILADDSALALVPVFEGDFEDWWDLDTAFS
jgi:hypothetical protein